MDHRTYGETKNCKGCRYWSEMIARSDETTGGQVAALCLSQDSPNACKYTLGFHKCDKWASGHLGAIDEPGQSPNAYGRGARVESEQ